MDELTRDWRGHVIVCGLRNVGPRIVEQLALGEERVVVVDDAPDPRLLRLAQDFGAVHLPRSGRRTASLEAAGIAGAAALICTDESDLDNLEVALLAHRLRPDLRIVTQLGNAAVRRSVREVSEAMTVLDVAEIAAPALAEACLDGGGGRSIEIDDHPFVLEELTAAGGGTLRELYGDVAPVAVVPHDGGELQVCPGRDLRVEAGDRVVVISSPEDDVAPEAAVSVGVRRRRPRRTRGLVRRYIRGVVSSSERQLRIALLLLFAVGLLSVALLRLAYRSASGAHMTLLDATYFTTETLTTVGFGDFSFGSQSTWLRVWAILLMIIGAAVVTVLYALLTNLLISRRISQSLGRQVATRMREHVILVGLGSVGLRVLEYLTAAGQPVVVLESDEDNRFLARARALRVPVVFGDATVPASLEAANLAHARAVAVLTSSDLANIESGLTVADLLGERRDEVPVVLRVFDRDLAATIEESFGFHFARSTAALAAPWFVGAALGLDIRTTFYVEDQPMLIGRVAVAPSGGLAGRQMSELSARTRVLALRRAGAGGLEFPPRRDTRFGGGDQAYLVGPYEELLAVLRHDSGTPPA
ncbi:MAG: NAD-binding protein [Jatrophihabitans sp.]|uniref:NAD-binding protein n=1 Tax=Jatrophihabitans sp. TaxID=1932789 RepID=UPI003915EEE1